MFLETVMLPRQSVTPQSPQLPPQGANAHSSFYCQKGCDKFNE